MSKGLPVTRFSTVTVAAPVTCNNCGHQALLAEFGITLTNHRRVSFVLRVCLDDEHGCKLVELDSYQWDEEWDELRKTLRGILKGSLSEP